MKKIKKMPLVIASIIILVLIAGISIFFLNARETKNEEKTEPKVEEKNERDDKEEEETVKEEMIEEKENPIVEEQPESNSTASSNTSSSSSHSSSSSSSNNNSSSSNNNYVAPSTPPAQNKQPQQTTPEPSCTPKKFYTAFRADFDSMAMCQQVGNQYKDVYGYYGFICDYDMDDCGDTYYMLTMFDGNGNYIDYPNIPKP